MLNPFPDLFTFSILTPTILRVAAALALACAAYCQWQKSDAIAALRFPIVRGGAWVVWVLVVVEALAAVGLFLGYLTQWAAILGALVALKFFVWRGRYPAAFPLSRTASALLFAICLALLVSGAGAFAFDIRL